jgi:hypothetical protein
VGLTVEAIMRDQNRRTLVREAGFRGLTTALPLALARHPDARFLGLQKVGLTRLDDARDGGRLRIL